MRRLPAILPATAATLLLLGCSGGPSSAARPESAPSPEAAVSYVVEGYSFAPLTVSPGQVVDVTNGDDEPHTLTAESGEFDTGSFDRADPGRFTAPDRPGTYRFVCRVHPSMNGTLTVR
jgi:plastocyanin